MCIGLWQWTSRSRMIFSHELQVGGLHRLDVDCVLLDIVVSSSPRLERSVAADEAAPALESGAARRAAGGSSRDRREPATPATTPTMNPSNRARRLSGACLTQPGEVAAPTGCARGSRDGGVRSSATSIPTSVSSTSLDAMSSQPTGSTSPADGPGGGVPSVRLTTYRPMMASVPESPAAYNPRLRRGWRSRSSPYPS